jgi:hypothetical protein
MSGTDQRITSGPAATAAASRRGKPLREKQAAYMAAPERFADRSDSSCTAGAVHTWPVATNFSLGPDVTFRGEAEVGRAAEFAASVENDPEPTRAAQFCVMHNTAFFNDVVGCSPRRQESP